MTNRVVMSAADGVKVSKPGVNVLTASDEDLVFNSAWSAFAIHSTGSQSVSWPTSISGSYSQNIPYGETFPSPPIVQIETNVTGNWTIMPAIGGALASMGRNVRIYRSPGGWVFTAFWRFTVVATNTRLELRGSYNDGRSTSIDPDSFPPPNFNLRYTVFTYPF